MDKWSIFDRYGGRHNLVEGIQEFGTWAWNYMPDACSPNSHLAKPLSLVKLILSNIRNGETLVFSKMFQFPFPNS